MFRTIALAGALACGLGAAVLGGSTPAAAEHWDRGYGYGQGYGYGPPRYAPHWRRHWRPEPRYWGRPVPRPWWDRPTYDGRGPRY